MTRLRARLTLSLAGVVALILGVSSVEASVSRDVSRPAFSSTTVSDSLAAVPQLALPSLTKQLRAIDERVSAGSGCVALCRLAASVDVAPFGYVSGRRAPRSLKFVSDDTSLLAEYEDKGSEAARGPATSNPDGATGHPQPPPVLAPQSVYDLTDHLVEQKRGTDIPIRNEYDAEGRRTKKIGEDDIRQFLYDDTSLLAEYDTNGNEVAKYDYGGDRLIRLTRSDEGTRYMTFDGLGSVTGLTNLSGAVTAAYHLDAWGNYRFTTELAPSKNRFGFTGHYWDNEAGLYYAKARFYDPFTARFTQADSFLGNIDDPPSLHRYSYANSNPTFYTDPTGNYSWSEFKGDAGWYRDAAGAFGQDIAANGGTRLGNIGRATVDQAKALPGALVDGGRETLARVHDVGVLASGSNGQLLSNVGQRSTDVLAGGGSLADLTRTVGIEQGKFAGELVANIYTGGGYNVAKESYLALQGTAAQAETRLNQAAGSAVMAASIGIGIKTAPVVVAEARSAIVSGRAAIASAAENVSPLLNSRFSLAPVRPGVMMSDPFGIQSTLGRVRLSPSGDTALLQMQQRLSKLVDRQGSVVDRWLGSSQNRWASLYRSSAEASPNFAKGIRGRFLDLRMRAKFREMFGDTPGVRIDQTILGSGSSLRPDLYLPNLGGESVIFDVGGPSKIPGIAKYQGLADRLVPLVPRQWF